ncbi:hypothetical protein [Rhodoferax antarcticus]|uniref:Virulence-associated protein E n=1 Tax=Rhodoferax antarcticus ANT.BR TaxID=1111071 RepID=A0A1Q8YA89_9BURK|nr:hypothetical protein [Rhodoferax antarcticus]APW47067.1 hypothetical protein RA876_12660 [Rhodoferax antarcticus]OLP04944.1 hypothetical protein BLL52_3764 [Rhodoferax antarcticus ANT.BR]
MSPIDNVLSRLEKVRQRQPGQWSARCPAHADKGPSLSVRESPDGGVLIHCFAGCTAGEIVDAMGMELSELFPPRDRPPGAPKRTQRLLSAGQALDLLAAESQLVAIAAGNVGYGVKLTEADTTRVLKAAGIINFLRDQSKGQYA